MERELAVPRRPAHVMGAFPVLGVPRREDELPRFPLARDDVYATADRTAPRPIVAEHIPSLEREPTPPAVLAWPHVSEPVSARPRRSARRRSSTGRAWPWIVAGASLAMMVLAAALVLVRYLPAADAPFVAPVAPRVAEPRTEDSTSTGRVVITALDAPAVAFDALPVAQVGAIKLPPNARGHRVFVDGKVMGDGSAPLFVECGEHTVQVGSGGAPRRVAVPCGSDITLD